MKRPSSQTQAFTISEMMVSLAMSAMILGASLSASIGLQKSFSAVDNFFSTHMQQIRIIDYLSRDVKRSTVVKTSTDKTTVTCTLPNYVISPGDPDAGAGNVNVGKRRDPVISITANGPVVNYGRMVQDAATINGTPTLTSTSAAFTDADVGSTVYASSVPIGTTIVSRLSSTTVTLSENAIVTSTNVPTAISEKTTVAYALNSQTIQRAENGVVTTIASSTDSLVPDTTDVEQTNTEYTATTVTFLPTFIMSGATTPAAITAARRAGTTVFAKAYLRNRRRG
jgi:hypothetical protein